MNLFYFLFMEEYKKYLMYLIDYNIDSTLEEIEERIKYNLRFKINKNEEGKIHSRYLGDRYEPAIIKQNGSFTYHYYLFDGNIRDCAHPFYVAYFTGKIIYAWYCSSERVANGKPMYISNEGSYYNIIEYKFKYISELNNLENILLCDEMEEPFILKFAD